MAHGFMKVIFLSMDMKVQQESTDDMRTIQQALILDESVRRKRCRYFYLRHLIMLQKGFALLALCANSKDQTQKLLLLFWPDRCARRKILVHDVLEKTS